MTGFKCYGTGTAGFRNISITDELIPEFRKTAVIHIIGLADFLNFNAHLTEMDNKISKTKLHITHLIFFLFFFGNDLVTPKSLQKLIKGLKLFFQKPNLL